MKNVSQDSYDFRYLIKIDMSTSEIENSLQHIFDDNH